MCVRVISCPCEHGKALEKKINWLNQDMLCVQASA